MGRGISPSDAHDIIEGYGIEEYHWPLTSIRRTITTLTDGKNGRKKILRKTDQTQPGPFGRPEHLWQWRKDRPQEGQIDAFGDDTSKPKHKNAQML